MDVQLKKGLLEFCVLSVLNKCDSYGYQIIKEVSVCVEISESTLYPILKRLEKDKYVDEYTQEYNGRLRKYYHITKLGKEHIEDFLNGWDQIVKIYKFIGGKDE